MSKTSRPTKTSVESRHNFIVTHRARAFNQVLTPSKHTPDMSSLRLCEESELRRGDIIGSGAFGTVYKVITPLCSFFILY